MHHPHITTPHAVSIVTTSGEILAHHSTEHPFSHYGAAIWTIEDQHPAPGPVLIVNSGTGQEIPLQLLGIADGWEVPQLTARSHQGEVFYQEVRP